jgi:hypothetical protein
VHDLVADLALVAEPHDLAPLRLQQFAHQPLPSTIRAWFAVISLDTTLGIPKVQAGELDLAATRRPGCWR